ncbi:hypothetical protein NM688_g5737 [Phlebia brevispora]|uniref:Uncharacterized protein n=1 Tax=Phlebia brevispora TaxID=194682 RepID=A0ACC1SQN0_9APHY|nr:hypothetical protein NM688_g5737 [Phlebia brevispora]
MSNGPASIPILPPGTSLVPGGLELTFGVPFVSIIISAFLTGILTLQTFKFFSTYSRDPLALKLAVAAIFVLDLAQFASIVDFTWWYLVRNWGNLTAITIVRISYGLAVVFATPVILIVQLVYIYRIYRLVTGVRRVEWLLLAFLVCIVLVESAFGFRGASFGLRTIPFVEADQDSGSQHYVVGVWLGTGAVADLSIASVLVYNLVTRKTGFKSFIKPLRSTIITKLVVYAINTAAFTSVVAIADIICYYSMPNNNVHLGLNMLLCKLFSNSLLASLNRRDQLKGKTTDTDLSSTMSVFGVAVQTTRDSRVMALPKPERAHKSGEDSRSDFHDGRDIEMFKLSEVPEDQV